ncbi:MAG: LAGLIDADG family homing endonuclease [Candidatus Pacearchaeota archaeon]|nr:LAGLIDADG family homing endonuclease [Candidatus Pacearchaeota archaeon]
MSQISKEWLIGFIEGEGNFNVILSKYNKSRSSKYLFEFYPILQFRIFFREDDLAVLEKIKETFGIGRVYKKTYEYSRSQGINARDQYAFYVTSIKELSKLKEILNSSEFHTKKKKDMEIFFRILDLKSSKQHLNQEGYNQIINLCKEMNSTHREVFKVKPANE